MRHRVLFYLVLSIILASALFLRTILSLAEDKDWQEKKSTHFIVYSAADIERGYVDRVIRTAEKYYHSLEDKLGFRRFDYWTWENRVKIYIYSDKDGYIESSGRPEWSGGSVNIDKKVINSYYWENNFFEKMLPHELAHIVFREYIGFKTSLPLWLDEGFAAFNEQDYYRRYVVPVLYWAEKDKSNVDFYILDDFTQKGIHSTSSKSSLVHYCYSVSLVHYLWHNFGREKFQKFCKVIREDGYSAEESLFKVYRFKDIDELNKKWVDYLLSKEKMK
jgi:hypothetical protein